MIEQGKRIKTFAMEMKEMNYEDKDESNLGEVEKAGKWAKEGKMREKIFSKRLLDRVRQSHNVSFFHLCFFIMGLYSYFLHSLFKKIIYEIVLELIFKL